MKNVESIGRNEVSFGREEKNEESEFKIKLIPIENDEIEKEANEGIKERKKKLKELTL